MYIGLISDTHGVFSEEFKEFLQPVDQLWHAGDFGGGIEFLDSLRNFKDLVGVYGNIDGQDIRRECPLYQYFECEGKRILMIHIGGYPGHYDLKAYALIQRFQPDIFISGHSHILKIMPDKKHNLLHINPGACGLQGWQVFRTALRFKIEDAQIKDMEIFKLERNKA